MTTNHIFYIPLMLFIGVMVGMVLGKRAAYGEIAREARKEERRRLRDEAFGQRDSQ